MGIAAKEAYEGRIALPANTEVWLPNVAPNENQMLKASNESQAVVSKSNRGNYYLNYPKNDITSWYILEEFSDGLWGRLITEPSQKQTMTIAKSKRILRKVHEIHIVRAGDSPFTIASK